jgi:hypothetical protein
MRLIYLDDDLPYIQGAKVHTLHPYTTKKTLKSKIKASKSMIFKINACVGVLPVQPLFSLILSLLPFFPSYPAFLAHQ